MQQENVASAEAPSDEPSELDPLALLRASLLTPSPEPDLELFEQNWAGNVRYAAAQVVAPKTIEELQEAVLNATSVRVYGTRHSFNGIGDTDDTLISLGDLESAPIEIDVPTRTVTCAAHMTLGDLANQLEKEGWALRNMPSSPCISLAGAVATASHGSGDANTNLLTEVVSVEYVNADGELVPMAEIDPSLHTCSLGSAADPTLQAIMLGGLGVMTQLKLRIETSYQIRQDVYLELSWGPFWVPDASARACKRMVIQEEDAEGRHRGTWHAHQAAMSSRLYVPAVMDEDRYLDDIFAEAYSVSIFITDWCSPKIAQAWFKRKVPLDPHGKTGTLPPPPQMLFGGQLSKKDVNPIADRSQAECTKQGTPGPWSERLPTLHNTGKPSLSGDELHSEYYIPRDHALSALRALRGIGTYFFPLMTLCEIRTVAADEIWLSPSYRRPSLCLHFVWQNDEKAVKRLLVVLERTLRPFAPRPHWGTLFVTYGPEIGALYPCTSKYRELVDNLDPKGKFRNAFIDRFLFDASAPEDDAAPCPLYGSNVRRPPRPYDILRDPARIGGVPEAPAAADTQEKIQAEKT